MQLTSKDFSDHTYLFSEFTCDGENKRPQLAWSQVPTATKSLALAMFDPDAPGDGFLH